MMDKANSINDHHETRRTGKLKNDKYAEDIYELSKAIRLNPKNFKLYFNRATLKLNDGDIEGARKDFKMCEMHRRNLNCQIEDYPLV